MKLINYRENFASNSSSSHSTFLVKDASTLKEDLCGNYFSWNYFVLTTKESLLKYVAAQIKANFHENLDEKAAFEILNSYFDTPIVTTEKEYDDLSVDHQSVWVLPKDISSRFDIPSRELVKDIIEYIKNKEVVTVGGNDNESADEVLENVRNSPRTELVSALKSYNSAVQEKVKDTPFHVITDIRRGGWVCLKDKVNNIWKYYNTVDGTKVTWSFDDDATYVKSDTPELVDLIITNACIKGCDICYRDCTPSGTIFML